ncbi:hypothetical protein YC2023_022412 [Brassica napus]
MAKLLLGKDMSGSGGLPSLTLLPISKSRKKLYHTPDFTNQILKSHKHTLKLFQRDTQLAGLPTKRSREASSGGGDDHDDDDREGDEKGAQGGGGGSALTCIRVVHASSSVTYHRRYVCPRFSGVRESAHSTMKTKSMHNKRL